MSDIANKVETLMEAMPYLQKYQGKIIVIKYGGNAMINEELKDAVMHDVVLLKLLGMKPVLSHGGGPGINKMLEKLDIPSSSSRACAIPPPTSCVLSRWCSSAR